MEIEVGAFLSDLARRLKPRAGELTDAIVQRFRSELPELWVNEEIAHLIPTGAAGHVDTWLDVLHRRRDVTSVGAPPSAIAFARLYAQSGGRITALLRAYRLGHATFLQLMQQEAARRTKDPELINATAMALGEKGFEYIDRVSEQAVAAYQEARDRWLQRRLTKINEAGTRIGTTLDITRTAQELADVGTDGFADLVTVDLLAPVLRQESTHVVRGPQLLRRVAQRFALDVTPATQPGTERLNTHPEGTALARVLTTGEPVLQRVTESHDLPWPVPHRGDGPEGHGSGIHSMLIVPLQARGQTLGLAQFFRDRTEEPFDDDDLLLAQEIASRAAVYIDNARRYTHQRATALTLQRNLLPEHLVQHTAVHTASRYLPAGSPAGVGGDWYDVIPLSGARVALVVGDVIGHGIDAAATMGRLRTAVRTLADIDLMPDELMTHLDDVVIRLQREEGHEWDEISATCLYAVYDPVSRRCSMASAGHLPPVIGVPQSSAGGGDDLGPQSLPELLIGPPLGLGGYPFETTHWELPEGTLLALHTDGLLDTHSRDADVGLAALRDVLRCAPAGLEKACDEVLSEMLPHEQSDDIALLLVRTRCLSPDHVVSWNLPSDPAAVAEARSLVGGQLAAWGLDDAVFTTELIVSELVTNAIRYGRDPVELRLIRDTALTCEVSDGSSTSPHLRRARVFDEGGRGLLIVAQLAEHWGTRHTRAGKVIWAEQSLVNRDEVLVAV
ncbi:ATP-binding SpoIIE family protein phosphatase [Streptomyces variegatus]|uniref:ATP-binding SpoIIE family protein phosphatase n=1 Tax=Streptomyces variegatus TaxID=284040 RepID=UPI003C2BD260